ncbi:MAG: N-acetyltransferase family protein [Oceanospirillales bacterium]|nr:MAG: N-acetyltransferase family protein [Oceanospirillales bacterium]
MPQHNKIQLINCRYEDHGDTVFEIFNDAILNTTALYEYEPRSKATIERWFSDKADNNFPVIGAINETGSLMGFASYGRFRPFPAFNTTIEHSIYIHQDFRGLGIGKLLLTSLIERAIEQDYHCMIGAIDADNTHSIKLHQQLGFEQTGRLPEVGFKFERWLDLVLYQKILNH